MKQKGIFYCKSTNFHSFSPSTSYVTWTWNVGTLTHSYVHETSTDITVSFYVSKKSYQKEETSKTDNVVNKPGTFEMRKYACFTTITEAQLLSFDSWKICVIHLCVIHYPYALSGSIDEQHRAVMGQAIAEEESICCK